MTISNQPQSRYRHHSQPRQHHSCHSHKPTLFDAIDAALSDHPGWIETARAAMEGPSR